MKQVICDCMVFTRKSSVFTHEDIAWFYVSTMIHPYLDFWPKIYRKLLLSLFLTILSCS